MTNKLGEDRALEWIPARSPLHPALPAAARSVSHLPASTMVFFYYDNAGYGNSDCRFYVEARRLSPVLGRDLCTEGSFHFARLFKVVTEPESIALVPPYESYLLSSHPDPAIAAQYETTQGDGWVPFTKQFDVPDELVPERGSWRAIDVPIWDYENTEDRSLTQIASELQLSDWFKLIWELNVTILKKVQSYRKARLSQLPAYIVGWEQISEMEDYPDDVAREYYGETAYGQLVSFLKNLSNEQDYYIPVFDAPESLESSSVTVTAR